MKKIACTYEAGEIFQHFGHTSQFKIYEVSDGRITQAYVADTAGRGHGALAGLLKDMGVDVLICGGIGQGAKQALEEADIQLYSGVTGDADSAAASLLRGTLVQNAEANCSHHGSHDNNGSHSCTDGHSHAHHCHSDNEASCKNHGCGGHN